jgi:hypothetical protein
MDLRKTFVMLVLSVAASANAGQFSITEHECGQMNEKRDGVKCAVRDIDGMGYTLLIRVTRRQANDPPERHNRVKYMVATTIHNFLASGGIWIKMRSTDKNGRLLERVCSKIKHGNREQCGEWFPVNGD